MFFVPLILFEDRLRRTGKVVGVEMTDESLLPVGVWCDGIMGI
jgi:hypothetical protein